MNLDQFDPLNSRDDLIKLLIETGISFSRPRDVDVVVECTTSFPDRAILASRTFVTVYGISSVAKRHEEGAGRRGLQLLELEFSNGADTHLVRCALRRRSQHLLSTEAQ